MKGAKDVGDARGRRHNTLLLRRRPATSKDFAFLRQLENRPKAYCLSHNFKLICPSMEELDHERQPMRLSVYEEDHPCRPAHDSCLWLLRQLPWGSAPQNMRDAMRAGFVFALSVCASPACEGSPRWLLDRAFPQGSLPSPEGELFSGLSEAARALGCSQFDFEDSTGQRASELAPLFFGGLAWLESAELAAAARLAFCQCLADACASRLFYDGRAFHKPALPALEAFESALEAARRACWPDAAAFSKTPCLAFGSGPVHSWLPTLAARERMSAEERLALDACCSDGNKESSGSGRL